MILNRKLIAKGHASENITGNVNVRTISLISEGRIVIYCYSIVSGGLWDYMRLKDVQNLAKRLNFMSKMIIQYTCKLFTNHKQQNWRQMYYKIFCIVDLHPNLV